MAPIGKLLKLTVYKNISNETGVTMVKGDHFTMSLLYFLNVTQTKLGSTGVQRRRSARLLSLSACSVLLVQASFIK
jgi:hypothetical protein